MPADSDLPLITDKCFCFKDHKCLQECSGSAQIQPEFASVVDIARATQHIR